MKVKLIDCKLVKNFKLKSIVYYFVVRRWDIALYLSLSWRGFTVSVVGFVVRPFN